MKIINYMGTRSALILIVIFTATFNVAGQDELPDILFNGTLKDQMVFIQEKTRIYENYRAVREDMFQKLKKNVIDSLNEADNEITGLKNQVGDLNFRIDTLNNSLKSVGQQLEVMTKTKDSIKLLGINVNKTAYNAIMWIIIAVLAVLLSLGFLMFKRNYSITNHTKKEFEDLKKEFEAYRKASREAREKMSMTHFNELKKLRGG